MLLKDLDPKDGEIFLGNCGTITHIVDGRAVVTDSCKLHIKHIYHCREQYERLVPESSCKNRSLGKEINPRTYRPRHGQNFWVDTAEGVYLARFNVYTHRLCWYIKDMLVNEAFCITNKLRRVFEANITTPELPAPVTKAESLAATYVDESLREQFMQDLNENFSAKRS